MIYNKNVDLRKTISYLETKLDILDTEFSNLNKLMIKAGFPQGVKTLKETAIELIEDMRYAKEIDG